MNTYPSASLYVGDLDPEVNESQLFDIFREIGPVNSIRVCRDAVTRRSLGYGYVNFQNPEDADRAMDTLNYTPIRTRPVRIMWCHRDPSIRKSGIGNIFIKNLDKEIDHKSLYDTFSAFGNILSCKVATDENGKSLGYGFVHFETKEAADEAIQRVNGMQMLGKTVFVTHWRSKKERGESGALKRFTNVYFKNFPEDINSEEKFLSEFGTKYGGVTSCYFPIREDGTPKGFGFINFKSHEEALQSIQENNGKTVNGKTLFAGRAQKKGERINELRKKYEEMKAQRLNRYQGVNLYIKNLDDTINDERVREEFSQFGTITSAKVMTDEKGISRGFGFVCFSTPEEATRAVTEMNGRVLGAKPLYVALAQTKEQRRAALEQQRARLQYRMPMTAQGLPAPGMYPPGMYFNNVPQQNFYGQMPRGPGYRQNPAQFQGMQQNNFVLPRGRFGRGNRSQGQKQNYGPGQQSAQPQQQSGPRERQAPDAREEILNISELSKLPNEEQKRHIGEKLYPLVQKLKPNQEDASKITGMLLEMETSDLIALLESSEELQARVDEAWSAYKAGNEEQEGQ